MRAGHLELFCGASGDMLLGALVDAGVPLSHLSESIALLRVPGIELRSERVAKRGIAATRMHVIAPPEHAHRHLPDIEEILDESELPDAVKRTARRVFATLAAAEARVHDIPVDEVHFHEVGALDAIADVVGVVAGFEWLGVQQVTCRAVPISHGTVRCAHGELPVPAPAVLRLIEGLPTEPLDVEGETVTPTAAALLRVLVSDWRAAPAMRITAHGYGAGGKEFPRPNVLRLMVGEVAEGEVAGERCETLVMLTTNIDDMNPEWLPPLLERLLQSGALDAWLTPVLMKKGRPAHTLSVLCEPPLADHLREIVYSRSTSLGIRQEAVTRFSLARVLRQVRTPWGVVAVKVAVLPNGESRAAPEYADCRRISDQHDVPLMVVYDAAINAWRVASEDVTR